VKARMVRTGVMALAVVAAGVWAQSQKSAGDVLSKAKQLHGRGEFDSTATLLRRWVKDNGKDPANEHVVPLLMDALVRTGQYDYADRLFTIYRRKYPEAAYMPRLWYLEGICLAYSEEQGAAVEAFSTALKEGLTEEPARRAVENVELLCRHVFTVDELSRLAARTAFHPAVQEVIAFFEISKAYSSGQLGKAANGADSFLKRYGRSRYEQRVREFLGKLKKTRRGRVQIGLLAPLSGYDAPLGKKVVRGVQLAVAIHNRSHSLQLDLVISDTKGDMVETVRKTRELVEEHKVSLLVGPVLSSNAVAAAAMIAERPDVLMLSPTATDEGIAGLGGRIFQMNVTLGALGTRIARFAVENLNIREFAILSPLSSYGMTLSKEFREEVRKQGGKIVAEEFFDEGANDFRQQFENLRKRLAEEKQQELVTRHGLGYLNTARGRTFMNRYLADSTIEVGGLFVPAEAEDVVMIAPQVYFHKIRTQMLGSTGWHNNKTILDGKRYVNNAVISTNLKTAGDNERRPAFAAEFEKKFKEQPDRVAALGYDATELLLKALLENGGNPDPKTVAEQLRSVKNYNGVAGRVTFDPTSGANTEATIMKISDKTFVRIH